MKMQAKLFPQRAHKGLARPHTDRRVIASEAPDNVFQENLFGIHGVGLTSQMLPTCYLHASYHNFLYYVSLYHQGIELRLRLRSLCF